MTYIEPVVEYLGGYSHILHVFACLYVGSVIGKIVHDITNKPSDTTELRKRACKKSKRK